MTHDGTIRTDWLPMQLTRGQAQRFAAALDARLREAGVFGGHLTRSLGDRDFVAVTTPGFLKGRSTVKARGCEHFRAEVRTVARALADEMGLRYGPLAAAKTEMPTSEIDTRLIEARKRGDVVLVYVEGTYYRGVPGEVERIDDWTKMTSTVVLNIGQRQVPLMDITKVEAA